MAYKNKLSYYSTCLFLLISSVIFSCVILEFAILFIFGEQPKFPRHVVGSDFGLRINEPNSQYRHKSADVTVWFRVNGQGMRANQDYSYNKPKGTKRIVSLGDSFTIGYEVAFERCFSSILEQELKDRHYKIDVLNAGVSGYSTAEEYLYLKRELLKYHPDIVLLSFYTNDIEDNMRTNLFTLKKGQLVELADSYIPMGSLANFLNTNWFFNWLSERSNAFVFLKEHWALFRKTKVVMNNIKNLDMSENTEKGMDELQLFAYRLTAAILEQIYKITRRQKIPFIILSIPSYREGPKRLLDLFPVQEFDVNRPGIFFISAKTVIDPYIEKQQLYWVRSHRHWTPFSHQMAGQALANLIVEKGLLN